MESSASPAGPGCFWRWLDDRLGIGALRYPVPAHANSLAYTLGGLTLASEFEPGTGAQEVVAIVAGAVLLLLGLVALRSGRRPAASG